MEIQSSKPEWLITIAQNVAWLVASAGVVIDALFTREAVLEVLAWYRSIRLAAFRESGGIGHDLATGFTLTAMDMFGIFVLCMVGVTASIAIEYYFRRGRAKGLLLKRIGRVFAVQVGIVVVSVLIQVIL